MANYAVAEFNFPLVVGSVGTKDKKEKATTPKVKKPKEGKMNLGTIIGALSSTAQIVNSAVGSYTGNKVRQTNISTLIGGATMAATAVVNPLASVTALSAYMVKRTIDLSVQQKNSEQIAQFKRSYMGNMTTNGSRWRGGQ